MLPQRVLYYGKDEPLPERRLLRAGPLTALWENGDLRFIKFGDHELLRRIYVAVRDHAWGTVPPTMSNLTMTVGPDAFQIEFDVENHQGEIDFTWHGTITGEPDGRLRLRMDGIARNTFLSNRIGFCVLHPAEAAGAPARVTHVDGSVERGAFPVEIVASQPVPPFAEMVGLAHEALPGLWVAVQFEGGIFEMEDQRNWSDASFKTFCPPLRLPYPFQIQAGARVQQAITVTLHEEGARRHATPAPSSALLTFTVDCDAPGIPLPELGMGLASHGHSLTAREVERLRTLHLGHLRADLRLAEGRYAAVLRRAAAEAAALGVPLHLALLVTAEAADQELAALRSLLGAVRPPVTTFLIYAAHERFQGGTPIAEVVAAARQHLRDWPGARIVAGTNADYIFLARSLPPLDQIDAVCFALHPQTHAFDNTSLVETLPMQAVLVANARRLARGLPVWVSPVTLKARFNPHAATPEPEPPPGELPASVDVRQMSLFGAGWTTGSLKYLAAGGAASVTCYETTGWRGVMETEVGSAAFPFQALAGCVFPLYHVLADAGEFAGGVAIPTRSSAPLTIEGVAWRKGDRLCVLVANLTDREQTATVLGLRGAWRVSLLDESTAEAATRAPAAFRAAAGHTHWVNRALPLELPPYALARLTSSSMS